MKYIDAEKLKAEINRRCKNYITISKGDEYYIGQAKALDSLLEFIGFLQQEHTEGIKGNLEEIPSNVDFEKLALEKYPIQMVVKGVDFVPFDDEDDTKEDLNEYEREAYLQGLKDGSNLDLKQERRNSYDSK